MQTLRKLIRDVPDFPKAGILFRDITPALADPTAFREVINHLAERYRTQKIDKIVAIESRGFIFGAPLAYELGCGFVPIRKPGKLPCDTHQASYELEYGTDSLEIHRDALSEGERVVVVDDLIATGGTARATVDLVARCGAVVHELAAVIELVPLGGRATLAGTALHALLTY